MRHYEITFLVHPDQSEEVPAMINRYRDMVESGGGKVHRVEDWGRRRLAYIIDDVHKAHYVMLNIESSTEVLRDIEKNFQFNDSILRHLVIRRKTAVTEASYIAKEKEKEDARESADAASARAESTTKPAETDAKQEAEAPVAEAVEETVEEK